MIKISVDDGQINELLFYCPRIQSPAPSTESVSANVVHPNYLSFKSRFSHLTGYAVLKTKQLTSSFKMFTVSSSSFQLTWRMKMGLVYLMFCGEFLICNRTAGKKKKEKKQTVSKIFKVHRL